MNYKYHLLKYNGPSTRLTCPNCGRKRCFVPYVDGNDQIVNKTLRLDLTSDLTAFSY